MPQFSAGVTKFQNNVFPEKKELFEKLDKGQSPEVLFITCSDSRIDTAMITQTDPGELFVCRNAGNIVPPSAKDDEGMAASIEFAVTSLKTPHIVICGHTGCGAMKGAMNPENLDPLPTVKKWLRHSRKAVDVVNEQGAGKSDEERMDMLLEQNVILQLQNLKTHPAVSNALAKGELTLHGWIYNIKTGSVLVYDELNNLFQPIVE